MSDEYRLVPNSLLNGAGGYSYNVEKLSPSFIGHAWCHVAWVANEDQGRRLVAHLKQEPIKV